MSSFSRTYNSFSGVDMVVAFNDKIIGEIQGVSYTVQREKAPIYTMGSADPRSFSRGKRGIAGSLVFVVFDRSALIEAFSDSPFLAWVNEYAAIQDTEAFSVDLTNPQLDLPALGTVGSDQGARVQVVELDKVLARPIYHDQVLPFELVLTAANEYGANSVMKIHGVEILNCGSGMSIDDITTDEACTFVARALTTWQPGTQVKIPNFTTA